MIAVSRLIVDNLAIVDATRCTYLAQLDMEPLGGHDNHSDTGRCDVQFKLHSSV